MNKQEAFAIINNLNTSFLAQVAHPAGDRITRTSLRNVDAEMVTEVCIVFKNKEEKMLVIPFTTGLSSYATLNVSKDQRKEYPSLVEIQRDYAEPIVKGLIAKSTTLTQEQKAELVDYLPDWAMESPSNPENKQKLEQYENLKKELQDKGLLQI
jgi:hypothetical protein